MANSDNQKDKKNEDANNTPSSDEDRKELAKDIDNLERNESDDVLAAQDAEAREGLNKVAPWYKKKKVYIPSIFALVILIIFAVPATRYPILGLFFKENLQVIVTDSQTNQSVSDATVTIDGKSAVTDSTGKVSLRIKVGKGRLQIVKKYYASDTISVFVGLHSNILKNYQLQATGRQVPISVVNKIGGAPIADATISADGTQAKTDSHGNTNIVLPANKSSDAATISASGYNNQSVTITITPKKLATNTFQIVPSGKVYLLSNASGRVDIVKTNLDGSGLTTVVAGTGAEDPNGTRILASNDWKYVALVSTRSGAYPSLYIINTSNDSLTQVDGGADSFSLDGWTPDDLLVYTDSLATQTQGANGNSTLKSVNPTTDKLTNLDSTNGQTVNSFTVNENYNEVNVLSDGTVLFLKAWQGDTSSFNGLQASLSSVMANDTAKKSVKTFSQDTYYPYFNSTPAGPMSVYFFASRINSNSTDYYEYTNGSVQQLTGDSQNTANSSLDSPSTYLTSPDGTSSLWSTYINGHASIEVGKSDGSEAKPVALLDNTFNVYGWYTNNYILLSKNNNELYIMPNTGVSNADQLIKISNYL